MVHMELSIEMVKKSISVTEKQARWIEEQIESGHFGNASEVFRYLIRERQMQEEAAENEIAKIRAALLEGEQSGLSNRTVDEIWAAARAEQKPSKHA